MPRTYASLAQLVKDEKPLCCAQTKEGKPCKNKIMCDTKGESVVITNFCHVHQTYKDVVYNSRLAAVEAFYQKVKAAAKHQHVDPDLVPQSDDEPFVVKKVIKPQTPSASKVISANTKSDSANDSEGEASESVEEVSTSKAPKPAAKLKTTASVDPELIARLVAMELVKQQQQAEDDSVAPTRASSRKLVKA